MPKKLKLHLNELKVQSFITELDDSASKQFWGGKTINSCDSALGSWCDCPTACANTCNSCGSQCATCVPSACGPLYC